MLEIQHNNVSLIKELVFQKSVEVEAIVYLIAIINKFSDSFRGTRSRQNSSDNTNELDQKVQYSRLLGRQVT